MAVHLPIIASDNPQRPRTRGDCAGGPRPCPWISCKYHLVDVVTVGGYDQRSDRARRFTIRAFDLAIESDASSRDVDAWADLIADELGSMGDTCALDVADRGDHTLDEVGQVLGVTRERIRQIELRATTNRSLLKALRRHQLQPLPTRARPPVPPSTAPPSVAPVPMRAEPTPPSVRVLGKRLRRELDERPPREPPHVRFRGKRVYFLRPP